MPTVEQVLEDYEKDPVTIIGRLLVAVDNLHTRVETLEREIHKLKTKMSQ